MLNSRSLRWALLGTGAVVTALGLGGCNLASISQLLPLALLSGLLGNGTGTGN